MKGLINITELIRAVELLMNANLLAVPCCSARLLFTVRFLWKDSRHLPIIPLENSSMTV